MEIKHLRLQLLSMANGDVDAAKHMESYVLGEGEDIKACTNDPEDPTPSRPYQAPTHVSVDAGSFGMRYELPREVVVLIDNLLSFATSSSQK